MSGVSRGSGRWFGMRALARSLSAFVFSVVLLVSGGGVWAAEPGGGGSTAVLLWFDTEDYLLPAADDAVLRLAEMLTARGIRATFKVVGEKARVLERRGRKDVIEALRRHAVGYHTDFHSVHPTVAEYLADCGLLDGVEEFVRREGAGAGDVRRIFEIESLACYGQPGSSWAAQAIVALPRIGVMASGVSCYVDEGEHIGVNQGPFWYGGALNVYRMGANCTRMDLHEAGAFEPACRAVSAIAERLAGEGGGLISIYYHPCEWVHREFWDGMNFRRGRNPARGEWKLPPQRSAGETDAAFERFAAYIDHIRDLPGVRFVTAADLPRLYPDQVRSEGVDAADLGRLARGIVAGGRVGLDFQTIGGKAFSLADQFELLTLGLATFIEGSSPSYPLIADGLLGPDGPPPVVSSVRVIGADAFRAALLDVRDYIRAQRRVPARVFVGAEAVGPADFLGVMARVYVESGSGGGEAGRLSAKSLGLGAAPAVVLPAERVAADTPELFGGWVIHREGFRAPGILDVARLQAWTLKPALRQPRARN